VSAASAFSVSAGAGMMSNNPPPRLSHFVSTVSLEEPSVADDDKELLDDRPAVRIVRRRRAVGLRQHDEPREIGWPWSWLDLIFNIIKFIFIGLVLFFHFGLGNRFGNAESKSTGESPSTSASHLAETARVEPLVTWWSKFKDYGSLILKNFGGIQGFNKLIDKERKYLRRRRRSAAVVVPLTLAE
jgi:hypothetical protein